MADKNHLPSSPGSAYARAGVDIDAGNRAVHLMKQAVRSTYSSFVLSDLGSFGGLFSTQAYTGVEHPVLVATTDGVGTKVSLAAQAGRYEGIGQDIVNHCINDILVQGARPLFFLDYIAASRLDPVMAAAIVGGMAQACRAAGCVLLGGETAEMPGVYAPGHFDVAGTLVGVVDQAHLLPGPGIQIGDVFIGLASSGPHTNGYSLIRKVIADIPLDTPVPGSFPPVFLGDALLEPHRSYFPLVYPILQNHPGLVKGLAHITGGGFYDNIPRILPENLGARIYRRAWPVPPLFEWIGQLGQVDAAEMHRVFNMGIGMVVVVSPGDAARLIDLVAGFSCWQIGEVVPVSNGQRVELVDR